MSVLGNFKWVNRVKIANRSCKNSFKNQGNQDGWPRNSDKTIQYLSSKGYSICVACGEDVKIKTKYVKLVDMINHLWVGSFRAKKENESMTAAGGVLWYLF